MKTITWTRTWPTAPFNYIREQNALAPDKPFFVYYAPGTAHAPHHAPKEWIERFKGQFDQGWDKVREETFARQKKNGHHSEGRRPHSPAGLHSSLGLVESNSKRNCMPA